MNKNEWTAAAAKAAGVTQREASAVLEAAIAVLAQALAAGEKIHLAGFGTFDVQERSGYLGKDPRSGEPRQIPPSRTPAFRPAKQLKALLQEER